MRISCHFHHGTRISGSGRTQTVTLLVLDPLDFGSVGLWYRAGRSTLLLKKPKTKAPFAQFPKSSSRLGYDLRDVISILAIPGF